MPRRTRSTHIAGRISVTNATNEDIDFLESKRANMTDTKIIVQAIHIWRLYETGQIFREIKAELKQELLAGLTEVLKNMNITRIQSAPAGETSVMNPTSAIKKDEGRRIEQPTLEHKELHESGEFSESELREIFANLIK